MCPKLSAPAVGSGAYVRRIHVVAQCSPKLCALEKLSAHRGTFTAAFAECVEQVCIQTRRGRRHVAGVAAHAAKVLPATRYAAGVCGVIFRHSLRSVAGGSRHLSITSGFAGEARFSSVCNVSRCAPIASRRVLNKYLGARARGQQVQHEQPTSRTQQEAPAPARLECAQVCIT